MLRIFKFTVTPDTRVKASVGDGSAVREVVYTNCLAIVLAHDLDQARALAKSLWPDDEASSNATWKDVDRAWIDKCDVQEIPIDQARALGGSLL